MKKLVIGTKMVQRWYKTRPSISIQINVILTEFLFRL